MLKPTAVAKHMIAGSFEANFELDLLFVDCDLAELANRSDKTVDIGDFALQRNFPSVDPRQVKQIINQSRLKLQITAYDKQVRTDRFWQIRNRSMEARIAKIGVSGVRNSWLKIARNWSLAALAALALR